MQLVSFDPFRSLHIPGVTVLKPDHWLAHRELLRAADAVLFPEFWQLDALQYALGCRRLFPSPSTLRLGHDKTVMTRALEAAFPAWTPFTLIRANTSAGREEILDVMNFPFVVKVPRASMGRGVRLVGEPREFIDWCVGQDVLYAQEYLPITRDLRLVWVGDRVIAAYWRQGVDGFLNNVARGGSVSFDDVPACALDAVATVARAFGIDHAGFDVAVVDDHPYLLEFNVRFGNQALIEHGIRVEEHIHAWLLRQLSGALSPLPHSA